VDIDFEKLMAGKSAEDLQKYITDNRYTAQAINAAVNEIKKRGIGISEMKQEEINEMIEQKKAASVHVSNVVTDTNAPLFYAPNTIWLFTICFGTLAGAILLSIDLYNYRAKNNALYVLLFAIPYNIFTATIFGVNARLMPVFIVFAVLFNAVGGVVLNNFFWRRYIGKHTQYRAKTYTVPLLICILLMVVSTIAIIIGMPILEKF
jgi:hypothetical protein